MHYLITGGCGFIGSHLAERLLAGGHAVTIVDDLSSGKRDNVPASAQVIVGDVTTPGIFDSVVENIDGCFHLAAIVSVQQSAEAWLASHRVNAGGQVALLDALARKRRKIPVVFASSAATYGNNLDVPLKETAACVPLSAYGVDKLACEWYAKIATSIHGIPAIGLRFFNVYGPRQDPSSAYSGVISILASRMKQQLPVTIYDDGEQTRDFIYVGDVVDGLVMAMQKLESKQLMRGIFNICTGVQTSVNELVHLIVGITGTPVEVTRVARRAGDRYVPGGWIPFLRKRLGLRVPTKITHVAPRPGDIRISAGDPALSRQMLGFQAVTPLQDGLERTLKTL